MIAASSYSRRAARNTTTIGTRSAGRAARSCMLVAEARTLSAGTINTSRSPSGAGASVGEWVLSGMALTVPDHRGQGSAS